MAEEKTGSNGVRVPPEAVDFELRIKYNVLTKAFELTGFEGSRLIALGMLEYAKAKLMRLDAQIDLQEQMANAPRIAPGGAIPMRRVLPQ